MLAKYIPGGVWTPTARVVALRRFGVTRHAGGARVDPARGRALGGRRCRRLRRRARDHRRRRRAADPARRLRGGGRAILLYPPVFGHVATSCCGRSVPTRSCRSDANDVRAARLLRAHVAARRRRPLLHAPLGRGRPVGLRRSRTSAASRRSVRSSPCSPSSRPRGSASARRRCTGCCSRSRPRRSRSARRS